MSLYEVGERRLQKEGLLSQTPESKNEILMVEKEVAKQPGNDRLVPIDRKLMIDRSR